MSSVGNDVVRRPPGTVDLYVSGDEVVLVDAESPPWRHDGATIEANLDALTGHLGEIGRPRRLCVWMGASVCRPVSLAPIEGRFSARERRHITEQTAIARSGLKGPCRVVVDGHGGSGGVAVVAKERVLAAIDRVLESAGLRAFSIRPWWGEALKAALGRNPALQALGICEGRAMTILSGEGQQVSAQTHCPVDGVDTAEAAFARVLVSTMVAPEDSLAVMLDWRVPPEPGDAVLGPDVALHRWVRRLGARP